MTREMTWRKWVAIAAFTSVITGVAQIVHPVPPGAGTLGDVLGLMTATVVAVLALGGLCLLLRESASALSVRWILRRGSVRRYRREHVPRSRRRPSDRGVRGIS